MKLELKHLLAYLHYELRAIEKGLRYANIEEEYNVCIIGVTSITENYSIETIINGIVEITESERIKLILSPLSDYCGKMIAKDVMSLLDCDFETVNEIWDLYSGAIKLEDVKLKTWDIMCKNHIDFNRLIENDLAVDKKTL